MSTAAMNKLGPAYDYVGEKAQTAVFFKQALAVNPEKAELEKLIAAVEGRK